jgi:PEGA domain
VPASCPEATRGAGVRRQTLHRSCAGAIPFGFVYWLALALALLVVTVAPAARADDPPESAEATDLKKRADAAMDGLKYEQALDLYTRAYALSQDPAVLYNRGRVHQARSEYPQALDDFQRFEHDASPATRAKVPHLARLLAEVRARVSTLVIRCDKDGAQVTVRGVPLGTTPLAAQKVNSGDATIEVVAPGYPPFRVAQSLPGGEVATVDVHIAAASASTAVIVVTAEGAAAATVFVDGTRVGQAPVEVSRPPGTHVVVVRREGAEDVERSIVVAAGERRSLNMEQRAGSPITSRWWFWTAIGVGVAAGAATVFALTREKSPTGGDNFGPKQVAAPLVSW